MKTKITKRAFDLKEIGTTGLKIFSGSVYEEFVDSLQGKDGIKVYREMADNDPVVGAMLFSVQMLIRGVKWEVKPASDSQEDLDNAEFVKSCLHDMEKPWSEVMTDIITFIEYGFSVNEIVYKKRLGPKNPNRKYRSQYNDGKWGWRKMPLRSQDTIEEWIYDEDSNLIEVRQVDHTGREAYIPDDRFLLFRTTSSKDNPEGRSALRNAFRPWYMKKLIEEFEGIGIERDLAGLPMAYVPSSIMSASATDDEKALYNTVKSIVENVRNNSQAGIVFPSNTDERGNKLYEFQLLSSSGQKQFDTNQIISRYNSTIAQTMLADFILIGHKGVGSFALSSDKTKMFSLAIGAWLDSISEVFNKKAIPLLFEVNGIETENLPKLKHGDIEKENLVEISQFCERLVRTGVILPDEKLENHMRGIAEFPLRDENSKLNPTFEVKNEITDEFKGEMESSKEPPEAGEKEDE